MKKKSFLSISTFEIIENFKKNSVFSILNKNKKEIERVIISYKSEIIEKIKDMFKFLNKNYIYDNIIHRYNLIIRKD